MLTRFQPGDHVADAVDDCLHGLLSSAEEQYVLDHAARCPLCSTAMAEARQRLAAMRSLAAPEPSAELLNTARERVKAMAILERKHNAAVHRWAFRAVAAILTLVALIHLYLANDQRSGYDLRVLGQRELVAGTRASLRTQLVREGEPVAGATVTLSLTDKRGGRHVQLASYTTDAAGTGSPRFDLPDWPDGTYTLTTVAKMGFHAEQLTEAVTLKRASRVMFSTDKPVYQPGQTIHMRALALRRPDFKPVTGQEATFLVTDPAGNIILKRTAVTSAYGLASADCPLAAEIAEGDYRLTCRVGGGEPASSGATESQATVEVKRYALPKFKVSVQTDKPFYGPGERVRASVQADYFFGKPVNNARVDLALLTSPAGTVNSIGLATAHAVTDEFGKAALDFVLPPSVPGLPAEEGDSRLSLSALVKDPADQSQARAVPLTVTTRPIRIEAVAESGSLVQNLPNRVFLLTTYADGRPARTTVSVAGHGAFPTSDLGVAVFELTPHEDRVGLTMTATDGAGLTSSRRLELFTSQMPGGDYLVRTDKAVYKAGETLNLSVIGNSSASKAGRDPVFVDLLKDGQTLLTTSLRLSKDRGSLAVDLTPDLVGTLQLRTYRFDAEGFPIRKTRLVYVQAPEDLTIAATLDRAQYRPGDTARLQFRLTDKSGKPRVGALSLAAVDEAVFSVLPGGLSLAGMEKTFFTLDQELLRPVYTLYPKVNLSSDDPGQSQLTQALFSTAMQNQTSRDALLQRLIDRGHLSLRALRYLDTEWGRRALEEQLQDFELPAAQKAILLGRDGSALEARTGPENVARAYRWERTRREWMPLLWVGAIVASGVGLLIAYRVPRLTELLVVAAIIALLIAILLPSLGKARELSERSVASSEAKGLLQTLQSANEEDPSLVPAAQEAGAPARLRQFFPETLLWRPELITDDQGVATLELPLADSITTWRVSSSAVTADGLLGALQTPIEVFQPFFIDLNVPPALTRGDEVALPVTVYNYLPTAQTITVNLTQADWFDLGPDPATPAGGAGAMVRSITLAPKQVGSLYFRIRATRAGTHAFTLAARTDAQTPDAADALQQSILVLPGGQRQEKVSNGTIVAGQSVDLPVTLPPGVIENSACAALKIYPTTFSQLVEGLDSIFRMPHGCFEQTSSTTYPNVLALDYLRRANKTSPQVEATARKYIHLGYQRLLTFEVQRSGGFDWYGGGPANVTVTAYGLLQFTDMARVHPVDPKLLERTRRWLLSQQKSDGTWQMSRGMHNDPSGSAIDANLAATAYVAWAVFSSDATVTPEVARTQAYLRQNIASAKGSPYLAALVANALLALDPADASARDLVASLESTRHLSPDGKLAHWPLTGMRTALYGRGASGSIETTALAALAMIKAGGHTATTRAALHWLISQKDGNGTWHSTQATVLALKAITAGTGTPLASARERRLTLSAGGKVLREIRIPAGEDEVVKTVDLTALLSPGAQNFRLHSAAGDATYQLALRYHTPSAVTAPVPSTLSIHIDYGQPHIMLADTLRAKATLRNTSDKALPMILLDLPIVPGLVPDRQSLDALVAGGVIDRYELTTRQIFVYVRGINAGATIALPYTLRSTMPVKVQSPPASVYEYYNPQNRATSEPVPLEVREL